MNMKSIHIYAQEFWHNPAFITGDKTSLKELRDALDVALTEGVAKTSSFASDGEGYDIHIAVADTNHLPLPYTDDIAKYSNEEMNENLYKLFESKHI